MSKILNILLSVLIGIASLIAILGYVGITPDAIDFLTGPDFDSIVTEIEKDETKQIERVILKNTGVNQIKNVVVHISSGDPIWKINQLCSEATFFSANSTDYKIKFERMSVDIPCLVDFQSKTDKNIFNIDTVGDDAVGYHYYPGKEKINLLQLLYIILLVVTISLAILASILMIKRKKTDTDNSSSKNSHNTDDDSGLSDDSSRSSKNNLKINDSDISEKPGLIQDLDDARKRISSLEQQQENILKTLGITGTITIEGKLKIDEKDQTEIKDIENKLKDIFSNLSKTQLEQTINLKNYLKMSAYHYLAKNYEKCNEYLEQVLKYRF